MMSNNNNKEKEFAKLESIAKQEDLNDSRLMGLALRKLTEAKDRYYVERVVLKNVEGNEQTADYGDFYYRKWTAAEVIELRTRVAYKKAEEAFQMMALRQMVPPWTRAELEDRLDMYCDFVARAAHPNQGFTKENLREIGNQAWLEYCYLTISERTGIGIALGSDIDKGLEKFRGESGRLSDMHADLPELKKTAKRGLGGEPGELAGIMGGVSP
jgi:hypothetical protein